MAKVKTTVILPTVKTSIDSKNWIDGTEHNFEITIMEQEGGEEAVVFIPESACTQKFTCSEIKELYKALEQADRIIGE